MDSSAATAALALATVSGLASAMHSRRLAPASADAPSEGVDEEFAVEEDEEEA